MAVNSVINSNKAYFIGESTDTKPVNAVQPGSIFIETDTQDQYIFGSDFLWHLTADPVMLEDGYGNKIASANGILYTAQFIWQPSTLTYINATADASGALITTGGGGGGGGGNVIVTSGNVTVNQSNAANLQATVTIASGQSVNVGNFPTTQAVSGNVTVLSNNAANLLATVNVASGQSINIGNFPATQPVSGSVSVSNFPATQPVSGTVALDSATLVALETITVTSDNAANLLTTATLSAGTANIGNVNVNAVGGTAVAATAKGSQGTNFFNTQDAKDSGRTYVTFYADRVTGVTTEALMTFTNNKAGTTASGTSYTVTANKTFRIQSMTVTILASATTAINGRVRLRTAGTVSNTSPILINVDINALTGTAAAGTGQNISIPIPDGLEIAAGQQLGISQIVNNTSSTISVNVVGFEY